MARKLDDVMAALPKTRQQRIEARAMELATLKDLRSEPRWSAALQIARAAQTHIEPSDHEHVVAHLSTVGPARLRDCLKLCGSGSDSFDALLGLVSSGILFLDPPDDLSLDCELRLEPKACDITTISWLPSPPADHLSI